MILQSHPSDARTWVLLAAPRCLLALPSEDAASLDGIAERVSGPDGFRAALELLIAGGIATAPDFALVDGDSTVARVVLRGDASLVVTATDADAAEVTISGVGVATWSERVLEGAGSLRLQVPGSTWTVRLEPAAVTGEAASVDASADADADASVDAAPVTAPVAEVTLVPKAQIEVPAAVANAAQTEQTEHTPESDPEPYDFLFGDTIYRTQSGASIRIPNPDPERPGDHDGDTVLAESADLPEAADTFEAFDTTVIAPIPGYRSSVAMPAGVPEAARRVALQLERSDGSRESLSEPVLIGRAPTVPKATPSGSAPRLITIVDDKDISRSHLRVAVEGDAVVVTDLESKNGTVVTLPGGSPRKLRGGEPTVVLPGTLIDLGGGVTFLVRED